MSMNKSLCRVSAVLVTIVGTVLTPAVGLALADQPSDMDTTTVPMPPPAEEPIVSSEGEGQPAFEVPAPVPPQTGGIPVNEVPMQVPSEAPVVSVPEPPQPPVVQLPEPVDTVPLPSVGAPMEVPSPAVTSEQSPSLPQGDTGDLVPPQPPSVPEVPLPSGPQPEAVIPPLESGSPMPEVGHPSIKEGDDTEKVANVPEPNGQAIKPELLQPLTLPKPEGAPSIPEVVRNQPPLNAVVTSAEADSHDDDGRHSPGGHGGPRPPLPGHDQPSNPWISDQVQQFPTTTDIDVEGDDNTVTVINNITNIQQVINNINITNIDVTKIEDRRDWLFLRNLEHPDVILRVPVEHGRPVHLNPGWCGGRGGAWSFSAAVAGSNFSAAFAGSGVFHANNNCGYSPPPAHPQYYPDQLYVCPPRGHVGPPVLQGRYVILSATVVYAPEYNVYYYGNWQTQTIQNRPQKVFVLDQGWSPDTVFQQRPIPGAPPPIQRRWGGFESSNPEHVTGVYAVQQFAREHTPLAIAIAVVIGAATFGGAAYVMRKPKKEASTE